MSAPTSDPELSPPVAPDCESPAAPDASFLETCLALSREMADPARWELGVPLLTKSEKWGFVWRSDFKIPDQPYSSVNRIICWRGAGDKFSIMLAIGQDVPPL
jgi:hypothetical protein